MRCYRCKSVLSETDYCNSCGADVGAYKRIIKLSNMYYNMGLEKAKIRDLTGAADMLKRSISMNKYNIQARNLLGLLYYEMGEFVEALSQWVVSKNLQPEKNLADDYIKEVQSNPAKLDSMNNTIRKFNKALEYAKEGSDDLAIIQLKKVVSMNSKFLKAYQLLGLMYIKKGEYSRARKALKKALAIDFNNTLTIKYLNDIEKETETQKGKAEEEKENKALSGNDVIIPETGYKDINYGLMQFVAVVVGIIIGAAMVFFLVTPARESSAIAEYKETINDYSENISKLSISLSEMQSNADKLSKEKESLAASLAEAQAKNQSTEKYDKLVLASTYFASGDKVNCAVTLAGISDMTDQSDEAKSLYEALKAATYQDAYTHYYNQAYKAENSAQYQAAIDAFLVCEKFQPQNPEILYHIATNNLRLNNNVLNDQAKEYFNKVIATAPNSDFAGWAAAYIN